MANILSSSEEANLAETIPMLSAEKDAVTCDDDCYFCQGPETD